MTVEPLGSSDSDRVLEVRDSAREWHKLQLAALGFVGLCGVLVGDEVTRLPWWLQTASGLLAVAALLVAGASVLLVATVAWPVSAPSPRPGAAESAASRLRLGIGLTFVAIGLVSLAASGNWWPEATDRPVQVTTTTGTACGPITDSASGWVEVDVAGEVRRLQLTEVVSLQPVESC